MQLERGTQNAQPQVPLLQRTRTQTASGAASGTPPSRYNNATSDIRKMSSQSTAVVYKPPARPDITKPSVILYGSIERGLAIDWQTSLAASLSDLPVEIINPCCDAWDNTWVEDVSDLRFKEQVEWEMDHAKVADVIAFYFKPETPSPITLLELGMYAGTGKAVVCCPEGFYKRGNIQVVCQRYGIKLLGSLDELQKVVRDRLQEKLEA